MLPTGKPGNGWLLSARPTKQSRAQRAAGFTPAVERWSPHGGDKPRRSPQLRHLSLTAVLVTVAALAWNAAAQAQTASPTSPGSSFGAGFAGLSSFNGTGGLTGSFSGTSFTGTSFSGTSFSGGFGMTGGTSGTNFTGSSVMNSSNRGFSGNWNFSGGSNRTSATGTYGGAAGAYGSSTTGAGSSFSPYYFNPLAAGAPNVTSPPSFNSPIYAGNATGGGQGGFGSLGGFSSNAALGSTPQGSTTATTGVRRIPSYTASPGFDYRPAAPSQVQGQVEQILARSESLSPNRNIRVAVEGPAVVLRGSVASEQDRRLAEALVRLTPGVFEVRNELQVP